LAPRSVRANSAPSGRKKPLPRVDDEDRDEHVDGEQERGPAREEAEHERDPAEELHERDDDGGRHRCGDSEVAEESGDPRHAEHEELLPPVHQENEANREPERRHPPTGHRSDCPSKHRAPPGTSEWPGPRPARPASPAPSPSFPASYRRGAARVSNQTSPATRLASGTTRTARHAGRRESPRIVTAVRSTPPPSASRRSSSTPRALRTARPPTCVRAGRAAGSSAGTRAGRARPRRPVLACPACRVVRRMRG